MIKSHVEAYKHIEKFNLLEKIDELRLLLYKAGICSKCHEEIEHDINEPLANCGCHGTIEDTLGPSLIQRLRMQITEERAARESIRRELLNCIEMLNLLQRYQASESSKLIKEQIEESIPLATTLPPPIDIGKGLKL